MSSSTSISTSTESEGAPLELGLKQEVKSLFTDSAYAELLEQVVESLSLGDIAQLMRVNRHISNVFTSSSRFQLRYRKAYHAIPSPPQPAPASCSSRQPDQTPSSSPSPSPGPSEELQHLLEREERLDTLTPSSIQCVHVPNSVFFEVKGGYMLSSESMYKTPVAANRHGLGPGSGSDSPSGYTYDGFSIWKRILLDGNGNEKEKESERKWGAFKSQGFWRWKTDTLFAWDAIDMCPEDNVVAITHEIQSTPCSSIGATSTDLTFRRIYFYTMMPPIGIAAPSKNLFRGGIPHPEAKIPFIEIQIPAKYHLHIAKIRLANNGRIGLSLKPARGGRRGFMGVWDWKKGVSLGAIAPSVYMDVPSDFRFIGPFVMTASFRAIDKKPDPPTESTGLGSIQQNQRDEQAADNGSYRPPARDRFCCLDIFEFRKPSNGSGPNLQAHRAYTVEGYDPDAPCTWDYRHLPSGNPIISFLPPPFDSTLISPELLSQMIPPNVNSHSHPWLTLSSCQLGQISIDDALLRGERDGVMTFTVNAHSHDVEPGDDPCRVYCQGTINLRVVVDRITSVMMQRIAARHQDARAHRIQTDLDTMWSNDPSVSEMLKRRLALPSYGKRKGEDETGPEIDDNDDEWDLGRLTLEIEAMVRQAAEKGRAKGAADPAGERLQDPSVRVKGTSKKEESTAGKPQVSAYRVPPVKVAMYDDREYTLEHLPFDGWSHGCSLRFNETTTPRIAFGSRVFSLSINWKKRPVFDDKGPVIIAFRFVVQDFNRNVYDGSPEGQKKLHRTIGGATFPNDDDRTQSLTKPSQLVASTTSSSLSSDISSSISRLLAPTTLCECPLPKPIALPRIQNPPIRSTSEKNDKAVYTEDVLATSKIESKLKFRETEVEMLWDARRPMYNLLVDQDTIVISMQHGAHILNF
ncbi:hypothetical protein IAT40_006182 [Kwoniella sp. CBS 6097]